MRFSVIIPCYQAAGTLAETLASIQAQTFPDWEALVIDDGSPDECAEIARDWQTRDSRFRLVSKPNEGLSSARNQGIAEATGEGVLFLDADDLIAPDKLALHAATLTKTRAGDRTIVYGGCRYFRDRSTASKTLGRDGSDHRWMPEISGNADVILNALVQGNIVPVSAPIVPTEVARAIGGFDQSLQSFEDWDFWIRCSLHGCAWKFDPAPGAETWIRLTADSMSTHDERMFRMEIQVRRKHRDLPAMQRAWRQKQRFQFKAMLHNLLHGNVRLAARRLPYLNPF